MKPKLSQSAQAVLARIEQMLADGFSGEIVLDCAQGGVRTMKTGQTFRPADLEAEAA